MKILGDLHGHFHLLKNRDEPVLVLGDLGIGFPGIFEPPFKSEYPIYFIRGNHDNPDYIKHLPENWKEANWHYIPDGTIRNGVLYVGGAYSIDWKWRTPGVDWWFGEELNDHEQENIEGDILSYQDRIHTVVSHDAPLSFYPALGIYSPEESSTAWFLDELVRSFLLGEKKPNQWFFGHHHKKVDRVHHGIRFRCVEPVNYGDYVDTQIVM